MYNFFREIKQNILTNEFKVHSIPLHSIYTPIRFTLHLLRFLQGLLNVLHGFMTCLP